MAGRPRKMAEWAAQLEDRAICLSADVYATIPEQYRRTPDPEDPLCTAWRECKDYTILAMNACERLGNLLRERAGIKEPGPTERFFRGDEQVPAATGSEAE